MRSNPEHGPLLCVFWVGLQEYLFSHRANWEPKAARETRAEHWVRVLHAYSLQTQGHMMVEAAVRAVLDPVRAGEVGAGAVVRGKFCNGHRDTGLMRLKLAGAQFLSTNPAFCAGARHVAHAVPRDEFRARAVGSRAALGRQQCVRRDSVAGWCFFCAVWRASERDALATLYTRMISVRVAWQGGASLETSARDVDCAVLGLHLLNNNAPVCSHMARCLVLEFVVHLAGAVRAQSTLWLVGDLFLTPLGDVVREDEPRRDAPFFAAVGESV